MYFLLVCTSFIEQILYEPRPEKTCFCICADQRLCFRYKVQFLYFLNQKFQASSPILWLYSLVFVGPVRNHKDRFSSYPAPIIFLCFQAYWPSKHCWKSRRQIFSLQGSLKSIAFHFRPRTRCLPSLSLAPKI